MYGQHRLNRAPGPAGVGSGTVMTVVISRRLCKTFSNVILFMSGQIACSIKGGTFFGILFAEAVQDADLGTDDELGFTAGLDIAAHAAGRKHGISGVACRLGTFGMDQHKCPGVSCAHVADHGFRQAGVYRTTSRPQDKHASELSGGVGTEMAVRHKDDRLVRRIVAHDLPSWQRSRSSRLL